MKRLVLFILVSVLGLCNVVLAKVPLEYLKEDLGIDYNEPPKTGSYRCDDPEDGYLLSEQMIKDNELYYRTASTVSRGEHYFRFSCGFNMETLRSECRANVIKKDDLHRWCEIGERPKEGDTCWEDPCACDEEGFAKVTERFIKEAELNNDYMIMQILARKEWSCKLFDKDGNDISQSFIDRVNKEIKNGY